MFQISIFLKSFIFFIIAATAVGSAVSEKAFARKRADLSYMKAQASWGSAVKCVDLLGKLTLRPVDPILLTVKLQDFNSQDFKKNKISKIKQKKFRTRIFDKKLKSLKTVNKKYFKCNLFKQAIDQGLRDNPNYKKVTRPSGQPQTKDCSHKLTHRTYSHNNLEDIKDVFEFGKHDPRKKLSRYEKTVTYEAVGQIRHKNSEDKNPILKYRFATALAVTCPDGINDVVVTTAHTFISPETGEVEKYRGKYLDLKAYKFAFANDNNKKWLFNDAILGSKHKEKFRDSRDWAVVRLDKPLPRTMKTLKIDGRENYKACIKMVAWQGDVGGTKETCQLKGYHFLDDDKLAGVKNLKHSCTSFGGSSGGALFSCKKDQLLGINTGTTGKFGTPYSPRHFSRGILINGKFKKAIDEMCAK